MNYLVAPAVRLDRKPTNRQLDLLRRVVATNGGGVSPYSCDLAALKGLVKRHMVQGKMGDLSLIVHTRYGLDYIRQYEGKK